MSMPSPVSAVLHNRNFQASNWITESEAIVFRSITAYTVIVPKQSLV